MIKINQTTHKSSRHPNLDRNPNKDNNDTTNIFTRHTKSSSKKRKSTSFILLLLIKKITIQTTIPILEVERGVYEVFSVRAFCSLKLFLSVS